MQIISTDLQATGLVCAKLRQARRTAKTLANVESMIRDISQARNSPTSREVVYPRGQGLLVEQESRLNGTIPTVVYTAWQAGVHCI
jgi:hypothetical protein